MPGAGGPKVGSKTSGIGSKTSLNRSQKCKKRLQDSTVKGSWVLPCNQGAEDAREAKLPNATEVQETHARPNYPDEGPGMTG